MAMAAMMPMIATTISSSISVNPPEFLFPSTRPPSQIPRSIPQFECQAAPSAPETPSAIRSDFRDEAARGTPPGAAFGQELAQGVTPRVIARQPLAGGTCPTHDPRMTRPDPDLTRAEAEVVA